jgi:membrane protease subunit HflK
VQRLAEESEAYKQQVIEQAKGETSRFLQTYEEYRKAPEVTRKRLYIETMEAVLSNSSKVMIKLSQGNSIMYLPLDKIINQGTRSIDPSIMKDISEINRPSVDQRRTLIRPDINRSREGR